MSLKYTIPISLIILVLGISIFNIVRDSTSSFLIYNAPIFLPWIIASSLLASSIASFSKDKVFQTALCVMFTVIIFIVLAGGLTQILEKDIRSMSEVERLNLRSWFGEEGFGFLAAAFYACILAVILSIAFSFINRKLMANKNEYTEGKSF